MIMTYFTYKMAFLQKKTQHTVYHQYSINLTIVNSPETLVSESETPQKRTLSTQSKVKNSKVTTTATTRARERKKSNVFFSFPIFLLFNSFSYLYRIITGKHVYKKNNARTICIRCTLYFQRHSLCPRESISQKGRRHHPFSETS